MGIQLKNNASGTLATAISASDTGIVLTTGNGASFPALGAGDYFYATLESTGGTFEVIKVTARSGDSMTVVRAQEGSTANSFAAGSRIELRVTVGSVVGYVQDRIVTVMDFGAVGDGVTDDHDAFFNAINSNPSAAAIAVFVPPGKTYKLSKTLFFTRPTQFYSGGDMEEPGAVLDFSGATMLGNATFKAALFVIHSSSLSGPSAITLPVGQVGTYGAGTVISGFKVINSPANGVLLNAPAQVEHCQARASVEHGFIIAAAATGIVGNANHSRLTRCKGTFNGKSGFHMVGSDANTFVVDACVGSVNGWYGFSDYSLLGGVVVGFESDANGLAAYNMRGGVADNSGLGATPSRTVFVGCYTEGGQPRSWSCTARAVILGATGDLPEAGQPYFGSSLSGFLSKTPIAIADTDEIATNESGGDFAKVSKGEVRVGWDGKPDNLVIARSLDYATFTLNSTYGPAFYVRMTNDFNNTIKRGRMYMDNGFALSAAHAQTTASAVPTTGTWDRGNVVWNNAPSAGGFAGWICTASGTPGTWKTFGAISA
jgi:hypothetical protein